MIDFSEVVPVSQNVQDTSNLFSIEPIKKCHQGSLQKDEKSSMAHLLGPMASCLLRILMVTHRPEQSIDHAFLHNQVYNLAFRGIPHIKKKKNQILHYHKF